jgi:hypothetical protein
MISTLETLANGMTAAGLLVAALFFFRFWKESRDAFFVAFSISFLIRALNTAAVGLMTRPNEATPLNYVVGICSSLVILAAIAYKNRRRS